MANNLQIDSVLMNGTSNKTVISSSPAEIPDGKYILVNIDQNYSVQSTYDLPDSNVLADPLNDSLGLMQWDLRKVNSKGAYILKSRAYNKVMSLTCRTKTPGAPVVTANDNNISYQMWTFCPIQSFCNSQIYVVRNVCSGLFLQVNSPGERGSKLVQGNLTKGPFEMFTLIPCE